MYSLTARRFAPFVAARYLRPVARISGQLLSQHACAPASVLRVVNLRQQRRSISTSFLVSIATPPAVFLGLVVTLWAYKCLMLVLFQDKIIYMPSVPPFSRSEKLSDYTAGAPPVVWRQETIRSVDSTKLAICIGEIENKATVPTSRTFVLYFQGNASSTPLRVPMLSRIMKGSGLPLTLVALSYRGFWASSGRASQSGIEKDATAAVSKLVELLRGVDIETRFIIWGQSIGAGVATFAAAEYFRRTCSDSTMPPLHGLILETPFVSVRRMLVTLYPQKWLPYRYLWPFLWNWWDSEHNLMLLRGSNVPVLILTAEKDEVVPASHGRELAEVCKGSGLQIRLMEARGALHHEASSRSDGAQSIISFMRSLSEK